MKLYKAIKKGILIFIITFICAVIFITPFRQKITNIVYEISYHYFDKMMNELEIEINEKIEKGEAVWGKDTLYIWGKKYSIYKVGVDHEEILSLSDVAHSGDILWGVIYYGQKDGKLFVVSEEGYAVIDSDNICRVHITVPHEDFEREYIEDENGNKIYYSGYLNNELVKYLKNFNEFSKDEQEFINKLIKRAENPETKDKPTFKIIFFIYLLPSILLTILVIKLEKVIKNKLKRRAEMKTEEN